MNYNSLMNKPTINYREIIGDNTVTEVGGITEKQFNTLLTTDLSSYYTKAQIDDLFSRSYVYREKSGNIVTFDCPASVNGIDKVVSEIVAVQDLHGYDSPWVGGAGKNKFDISKVVTNAEVVNNGTSLSLTTNPNTNNCTAGSPNKLKDYCPTLKEGDTVTFSFQSTGDRKYIYLLGYNDQWNSGTSKTITASMLNSTILWYTSQDVSTATVSEIQFELGQTATSYAPYSNICPISGFTETNVVVSPTTDVEDGTTYTTTLKDGQGNPFVCYGGTLSNENGVQSLTLTHGYIASYNGETLPSTWISDRDDYAEGTTPTTGAEVVYTLANPQQIPQDSLSIVSTAGTNNLWCDSGDITVKALDKIIQE